MSNLPAKPSTSPLERASQREPVTLGSANGRCWQWPPSEFTECRGTDSASKNDEPQAQRPRTAESNHAMDGDSVPKVEIPPCFSKDDTDALVNASPVPPVNRHSLRELDLTWIQSHINLRVDVNYDHDVHFMPISGAAAERRRKQANDYWRGLEAELNLMFRHNTQHSCTECTDRLLECPGSSPASFTPRLRHLFLTLKDLVMILVPDRDHDHIAQYLDVSLILQELSHGLLDVVRLADWLCLLLTSHCAPIRDDLAQGMAAQVREGAKRGDLHALVLGIESLFTFLEFMKLDIANHQIRSLRYELIDDTVAFQQDFFGTRIRTGTMDAAPPRQWYEAMVEGHRECHTVGETPATSCLSGLIHGIKELCLCGDADLDLPTTFTYDHSRLAQMASDIQDIVHLTICRSVFDQLLQDLVARWCHGPATREMENKPQEVHLLLQQKLMAITDYCAGAVPDIWIRQAASISLELIRTAFRVCRKARPANVEEETAKTTQRLLSEFQTERDTNLHTRSVALVIEQAAHGHARTFQHMTPLAISETQRQWCQSREQKQKRQDEPNLPSINDVARRLAHIAVIHWRVWADLVYIGPDHADAG